MGVPKFFRVILKRWPRILTYVVENTAQVVNGEEIPVDASEPNPNGIEFDNLYLDINNVKLWLAQTLSNIDHYNCKQPESDPQHSRFLLFSFKFILCPHITLKTRRRILLAKIHI